MSERRSNKVTALATQRPEDALGHVSEVLSEGAAGILVVSVTDDGEVRWSTFGGLKSSHCTYAAALLNKWAIEP